MVVSNQELLRDVYLLISLNLQEVTGHNHNYVGRYDKEAPTPQHFKIPAFL